MVHELKIKSEYFKEVINGHKTFEVRKNDRNFKVGDCLALNEVEDADLPFPEYTGRFVMMLVTYVLNDKEYCREGMVIMGMRPCNMTVD